MSFLSRKRWLIIAGLLLVVVCGLAGALRWLTHDEFQAEVQSVGGRYRSEVVDSRSTAFMKALNRQALTVFHWIDLEGSQADDAWLRSHRDDIRRQTHLFLFLRNSRITTKGLAALEGLDNLQGLDLTGTPLDDTAIDILATLPNAPQLYIGRTGISDSALAGLSRSPYLSFLCIDGAQATETGIAGLATCPRLNGVWILDADDKCLLRLTSLGGLTYLHLQGDQLTAESLPFLKQLSGLQLLTLFDTTFSDDELAELRQALPKCTVQQLDSARLTEARESSWE